MNSRILLYILITLDMRCVSCQELYPTGQFPQPAEIEFTSDEREYLNLNQSLETQSSSQNDLLIQYLHSQIIHNRRQDSLTESDAESLTEEETLKKVHWGENTVVGTYTLFNAAHHARVGQKIKNIFKFTLKDKDQEYYLHTKALNEYLKRKIEKHKRK